VEEAESTSVLPPGGVAEVMSVATAQGKLNVFDFAFDVTRGYTFWSGVIGGAFLTTATHGTDQFMVQRYLCSRSPGDARKALLVSGVFVLAQFFIFLVIGLLLYVFYTGHAPAELGAITVGGRVQTDRVLPQFIVSHLPTGLAGLVSAAILAAAMSSSLNASAVLETLQKEEWLIGTPQQLIEKISKLLADRS